MLLLLLRPLGGGTQPSAFISVGALTEVNIVAGGQTIVITLTNDTWVAAGAAFNAERQNIINGLNSAQAEALGWNAVVRALQGVSGVVRTSDTEVTITLDAQATYDITANETITVTVPSTAVISATTIVGNPSFDVTATPVVIAPSTGAGRGRMFRVRRSDFSSKENYEYALRAALLGANVAIRPDDDPVPPPAQKKFKNKVVVTDRTMKVSAKDMAALQYATDMEEEKLLEFFINMIESEWEE